MAAKQDGSLIPYFNKVAREYRNAGYPEIAAALQTAPGTFSAISRYEGFKFLGKGRKLVEKLLAAISSEEAVVPTPSGSGTVIKPNYLALAAFFAYDIANAGLNVASGKPITRGIKEPVRPLLMKVTYDASGNVTDVTTTYSGANTYTGATSVSGSGSVTLGPGSFPTNFPTIVTNPVSGTLTVSSASAQWSRDMTIGATGSMVVSSGASINFNAGSTFTLLGTLRIDLAPTFVTPITGTSTSTYDLETGATLDVKNPTPGAYTILSGFQSTGNILGDVTITGLADGQTGTLSETNGTVTLTITGN
jgi:hypothetical protein